MQFERKNVDQTHLHYQVDAVLDYDLCDLTRRLVEDQSEVIFGQD